MGYADYGAGILRQDNQHQAYYSWRSHFPWGAWMQKCVSTSTMEAELNAIAKCIKEAVHTNGLTHELFPHIDSPAQLHCDNHSAVIAKLKPSEHVNAPNTTPSSLPSYMTTWRSSTLRSSIFPQKSCITLYTCLFIINNRHNISSSIPSCLLELRLGVFPLC